MFGAVLLYKPNTAAGCVKELLQAGPGGCLHSCLSALKETSSPLAKFFLHQPYFWRSIDEGDSLHGKKNHAPRNAPL